MEEEDIHAKLVEVLSAMKAFKPADRSEKARYCAIIVTELEKALAIFITFIEKR
jgi:hypothetical protein